MARFSVLNRKKTTITTSGIDEKVDEVEITKKETNLLNEADFSTFLYKISENMSYNFTKTELDGAILRFSGIGNLCFCDEKLLENSIENKEIISFVSVVKKLSNGVLQDSLMSKNIAQNWEDMAKYWQLTLGSLNYECFVVLYIDSENKIISFEKNSNSFSDRVLIEFKNIISNSTKFCATSIVLIHNHPSKTVEPSKDDIQMTHELVKLLSSINVKILDHVIVSKNDTFSFRRNHIL